MEENSKTSQTSRDKQSISHDAIQADICSLIYQHYPDTIFTLDKTGNFIFVNEKAEDIIGYKPHEITGHFLQLIKDEYKDIANHYFQQALLGETSNFFCEVIHKNKQTVYLNLTDIPLTINGEIVGVFGFARDLMELYQKEAELLRITNSLNLAQEVANIGSWDYDVETDLIYCSEALYKIVGIEHIEGIFPRYGNLLEMVHPEDRKRVDNQFELSKKYGTEMDIKYRIVTPEQSILTVYVRAEAKKDKMDKVTRIIGVLFDISERIKTENRLIESEQKFEMIAKNLDVGIWSMDLLRNEVVYVSPAVEIITGYPISKLLSGIKNWQNLIHPDDLLNYLENQRRLSEGNMILHQYRIIHADGSVRWIEDKTFPISNSKGKLIRLDGIIQDITMRKSNEEKIQFLAYHDYLTGLPNRRMFEKSLEKLIDTYNVTNERFALLYLDLDRFKFVNDTLGHEIGDQLLIKVSERLKMFAGHENVFRMGGDEFTILQSNIGVKDPNAFGIEIIREIEKPFNVHGYDIHISTSVGISIFPDDGDTIKKLLMNSDVALYKAKELGKNNVQLFTKGIDSSKNTFTLENELRKAIQNDEFVLHYQPRVDTLSGDIVGAEALIRWNHPARGLVSPNEFIPQAEQTGLINDISIWVMKNVCKQLKAWKEKNYPLVPISINLSAKTLMRVNLAQTIIDNLNVYNISPKLIEIEITEESLMNNEECAYPTIQQLREMGIKFAIDDFGTGYSSIGYLKRFPVDIIKIDRSFINNFLEDKEDSIIVQSIILLAKGFNLKIVAEGVETKTQWEVLQALFCHYLQGYLFSKPVPPNQFIRLLLSKNETEET
ncbi:sensor domain-containing protein [Bacillus marasmi]|uniref:sensor domain-containing protein n=1 Tax=Bacillus marasmi TaxID=1926279 RepID=UPI00164E6729|nr:GGDEF domain-containing phosphodiesterase [Bacillus marasmi]